MKKLSASFLFMFIACIIALGQNSTIPSVFKFKPSNVFAIKSGNEVKGYCAFYMLDKKDSKNDNYVMQLYDENMNEVGQKKITMLKGQYLDEMGFDGNVLMVKFMDIKAKQAIYISYNQKAEETARKVVPISSKLELMTFEYNLKGNVEGAPTFVSAEGAGFVNYSIEQNKKYGYKINFFSDADIKKGWEYASDKNSDKALTASYLASSENVLLSLTSARDKNISMSLSGFGYNILMLDFKTGKKLADIKCENAQYAYTPMGAYFESDKFIVVGQFIKKGGNVLKDPSLGLSVVEYDLTGKVVNEKFALWKDGLGKFAEMKGNKLMDGGYIYFHKIVKAPNGNIVLVGEQFHKAANGAAIASAIMGGGYNANMTKLVITDFLFLEMSPTYDLVKVKKVEKGASDFSMNGLDYLGPNLAALFANSRGSFDYDYTTFNDDKSNFSVVYTDYDKLEGSKKEPYVGNVSYNEGKFTVDKVPYKRGETASIYRIYATKKGYFMLLRYYKKTKSLDFDLVKFNN